ncbi:replication-associated recombination protein A [Nakamurella antarctica]|uniref:Replication-associated recombination protein A n=1 Tax=Nakamurella antarctica TaxID=1902245 RepID=A0A3G8ZQ18_9ACTN|nr:replication-associated recombination protein A [Nakamurella antarctica]
MRPQTLDEVLGQQHLLGPGAPLRRLVQGGAPSSMLLYGPPGTGKTTLATLVAGATGRRFAQLSAVSAGVKEVRAVITDAAASLRRIGEQTVLFIDEVHRFSKTQQDSLLGAVEDRTVILIAATTENPFFSVVSPLLSRSLILQLQPLGDNDITELLQRAIIDPRGFGGRVRVTDDALAHLVSLAGGDARRSLTALEAAADSVLDDSAEAFIAVVPSDVSAKSSPKIPATEVDSLQAVVDLAAVERAVNRAAVRYDKSGDQHYDVTSAFIKSIRGSDVDAALHYLARMLEAGEDPRFISRRLMIHASEDIGLADPTALLAAVAAAQIVQLVGMPEARIALAQATIHLATAPKSNAVIVAIDDAMADVRAGKTGSVPPHLRDGHYPGAKKLGNAKTYVYPHSLAEGIAQQQYSPDDLIGRDYYQPTARGAERAIAERLGKLRRLIRGGREG